MDMRHEDWHRGWLAGLGGVLETPEDPPALPETPGGERPAIKLMPRPGVRAEVEIPPEAPGGAAVMALHEPCATPPPDYPEDHVFFPGRAFRVNRMAGGRVTIQVMDLEDVEESADQAVTQSLEAGWTLEDRERQERSVGPVDTLHIQLTFTKGSKRRLLVVAGVGDERFLVAEDTITQSG